MSAALELLGRALASLPAGEVPAAWIAGAGLAGLLLILLTVRAVLRPRSGADSLRQRAARARSLARRGATRTEIARATGLSQDAVTMLLSAPEVGSARRILPGAARIARLAAGATRGPGRGAVGVTSAAA